jgi:hypothetical protein
MVPPYGGRTIDSATVTVQRVECLPVTVASTTYRVPEHTKTALQT